MVWGLQMIHQTAHQTQTQTRLTLIRPAQTHLALAHLTTQRMRHLRRGAKAKFPFHLHLLAQLAMGHTEGTPSDFTTVV